MIPAQNIVAWGNVFPGTCDSSSRTCSSRSCSAFGRVWRGRTSLAGHRTSADAHRPSGGGERLQDGARGQAGGVRPGQVFQGDVQAIGDERDEEVEPRSGLRADGRRADRDSSCLSSLKGLFDLGELHIPYLPERRRGLRWSGSSATGQRPLTAANRGAGPRRRRRIRSKVSGVTASPGAGTPIVDGERPGPAERPGFTVAAPSLSSTDHGCLVSAAVTRVEPLPQGLHRRRRMLAFLQPYPLVDSGPECREPPSHRRGASS